MEELILVDEDDNVVGYDEKLAVHENGGRLHRAFSIFIYNSAGEMLLQQRAASKYHFGGLWTNACCSHPRRGETLADAVHRRLEFELGFDTELREVCSFVYRSEDPESGLVEHEYDHVFVGRHDGEPRPHPEEVGAWRWVDVARLRREIQQEPGRFTPWFQLALDELDRQADEPTPDPESQAR